MRKNIKQGLELYKNEMKNVQGIKKNLYSILKLKKKYS